MDLIQTFIDLTEYTIPYGNEHTIHSKLVKYLPTKIKMYKDGFGNLFCEVGKNSKTLFTSHMDTVTKEYQKVTHIIDENYISTNGKTILGGDNKAGVTILLWMINHDIPGTYYFFAGEEVGCFGSKWMLAHEEEKLKKFNKAIAFDRKEKYSIITFQMGTRTASDKFGNSLAKAFMETGLPYEIDPNGVKTDTAIFVDIIPECTNISAGVYGEHTTSEKLDIKYFLSVCDAVIKIDWENLEVDRNTSYKEKRPKKNTTTVGSTSYTQHQQQPIGYNRQSSTSVPPQQLTLDLGRDRNIVHDKSEEPKEFTPVEMANIYFDRILRGTKNKRLDENKKPYLLPAEQTEFYKKFHSLRTLYFEVDNILDTMGYSTNSSFHPDTNITYKSYSDIKRKAIIVLISWSGDLLLNGDKTDKDKIDKKLALLGKKIDHNSTEESWKKSDYINNNRIYEYFGGSSDSKVSQLVFENKNSRIVVNDFIKKYGGSFDLFNTFITLPFINNANFDIWPGYYKIYLVLNNVLDHNTYILFVNDKITKHGGNLKKFLEFISTDNANINNPEDWGILYGQWLNSTKNKIKPELRAKFKTDQDLNLLLNQCCNWVNKTEDQVIVFLNEAYDPSQEKSVLQQLRVWVEKMVENGNNNSLKYHAVKKLQAILTKFSYSETERFIFNLSAKFNKTEDQIIRMVMDFGFINTNELEELIKSDIEKKKLDGVMIDGKSPEDFGIFDYSWNNGKLDCNQDVDISNNELKKMPFQFGRVNGEFRCSKNYFTDLVGSPIYIKNDMVISSNPYLESFEGISKYIGGNLIMYFMKLEDFDIEKYPLCIIDGGIVVDKPNDFEAINEYIAINKLVKYNSTLFTPFVKDKKAFHQLIMKFKPEFVPLYTTIPLPKDKIQEGRIVWKETDCKSSTKNLSLQKYHIKGNLDCSNSGLISLLNSPLRVDKNYDCSNNELTNLCHISSHIGGNVIFTGNKLPMNNTAINDYPVTIVYGSYIAEDNLYVADLFNQLNDIIKLNVDKFKQLLNSKKEFHGLLKKLAPELFVNVTYDDTIGIGSTITLKSKDEKTMVMSIVEYPSNGLKKIWIESVLGKRLLSKKIGDTITIISSEWEITNIENSTHPKKPQTVLDKLSHTDLVNELEIDKDNTNIPIKKKVGVGSATKVKVKHKYKDGSISEYSLIFHIVDEKLSEDWVLPTDRSIPIPIGKESLLGHNLIGKEIGNIIELVIPKYGYRQGTILSIDNDISSPKPLYFGDDTIKLNSVVTLQGKFYPASSDSKMIEFNKKITIINEELDDTSTISIKKAGKWMDKKVGDTISTTLYMDNAPTIPITGNWEIIDIKNSPSIIKVSINDTVTIEATFNIMNKTTAIFETHTTNTETYGYTEKTNLASSIAPFTKTLNIDLTKISSNKKFIGKGIGDHIPYLSDESSTEFESGKRFKKEKVYNTNWKIIAIIKGKDLKKDIPVLLEA